MLGVVLIPAHPQRAAPGCGPCNGIVPGLAVDPILSWVLRVSLMGRSPYSSLKLCLTLEAIFMQLVTNGL